MADGQRRGHWGGLQTYLPNCCTSCHSTLSLFVSMVVHATSPKPFPSPLARVVVAPLQMRNFNVKTPSSLWTFHHAVPSPSFSTWELSVTENQCQSVCVLSGLHQNNLSQIQIQNRPDPTILTPHDARPRLCHSPGLNPEPQGDGPAARRPEPAGANDSREGSECLGQVAPLASLVERS